MDYIIAFNKTIRDLTKQIPNNETLIQINEYMNKQGKSCYYQALDDLGFRLGIEYHYEQLVENDEIVGYYPTIKYRIGNPLNNKSFTKRLRYDSFKNQKQCFAFLAKEYVYTLMNVPSLQAYLNKST